MEAVKQFNQELSALYEIKPPISKAKMTSITKGAIRSIKYYKHVVQSVEKFIQKCRAEYKIPGLYVIDSIVRQSRHQFGPDKDVFAPRFAKNIQLTFFHLYKCSEEEKSRVIRVLNLWQKNEVFASEVIQPLFDLANPNSEISKQMEEQSSKTGVTLPKSSGSSSKQGPGTIQIASMANMTGAAHANQLLSLDSQNIMEQPQIAQQIQQLLSSQGQQDSSKFSSNLLDDFDYSDEEASPRLQNNTSNMDKMEAHAQLLDALSVIMSTERGIQQLKQSGHVSDGQIQELQVILSARQSQSSQPFNNHVSPQVNPYNATGSAITSNIEHSDPFNMMLGHPAHHVIDMSQPPPIGGSHINPWNQASNNQIQSALIQNAPVIDISMEGGRDDMSDIEVIDDRDGGWNDRSNRDKSSRRNKDKDSRRNRRTGSRSRSRSRERERGKRSRRDRRSKSRSPYGDRHRRSGRGRSTSRDRRDKRDDDKRDDDRRREREKKGLPPMRKGYLSVCSTTLWVGHLSKLIAEDDLSDMFGEFGEILSINTIPPRGCAFICMNRRMDAYKALKQLHKTKLHGKQMTLAWAPGKGMKDKQWKDYWDVDLGVSYIPIDKLDPQTDMALLESGGMFDEDTMPEWMRTMRGVAPLGTSSAINVPLLMNPEQVQQTSPQHSVGIHTPSGSINVTSAPPPGFLNIASAAGQGLSGPQIPGLPSAPPGLPPFAIPPGIPPPGPGLLPPPGAPPGLLTGAPGLLPAPVTSLPGIPQGAAQTNLLLGQHRFPGLGGPLNCPPPGFPGFDVSQPPPGMTRPPLSNATGSLLLQPNQGNLPTSDRDRHSSGHSVTMEIEDAQSTGTTLQKESRPDKSERGKRDRSHRGSRWETGDSKDVNHERGNGERKGLDDERQDGSTNSTRDRKIEERDNNPLISRLRDLAGDSSMPIQEASFAQDGTRIPPNGLGIPNVDRWSSLPLGAQDSPFPKDTIARMPPPFVNQQGVIDANSQHFNGPPPGILPIFDNGAPRQMPPALFDGGQTHPGNFHGNGGNLSGIPRPPFGEFGSNRGSPRGAWRGRGNHSFNGRGGRGGFREGPSGNWIDEGGPQGRGAMRGGRGRGGFRDGSTDFNTQRNRENWDGSNRGGSRAGLRGRGGRGMPNNFGSSSRNEESKLNSDMIVNPTAEVDASAKRERKSRWGGGNEESDVTDVPQPTLVSESTSGDSKLISNESESGIDDHSRNESSELSSNNQNQMCEATADNGNNDNSQANGSIDDSNCSRTENKEHYLAPSQDIDESQIQNSALGNDRQNEHLATNYQFSVQQPHDNSDFEEFNGATQKEIQSSSEFTAEQSLTSDQDSVSNINEQKMRVISDSASAQENSNPEVSSEVASETMTHENHEEPQ